MVMWVLMPNCSQCNQQVLACGKDVRAVADVERSAATTSFSARGGFHFRCH